MGRYRSRVANRVDGQTEQARWAGKAGREGPNKKADRKAAVSSRVGLVGEHTHREIKAG